MKKIHLPKTSFLTNAIISVPNFKIILPILILSSIFVSCLELQTASREAAANDQKLDELELAIYVLQKVVEATLIFFNNIVSLTMISQAYKNAMKSFFSEYLNLSYLDFSSLGVGTVQFSIIRRANNLIMFLKIVCIRFASNIIFLSIIISKLTNAITFNALLRSFGIIGIFTFFISLIQIRRARLRKGINRANEKNGQKIIDILLNYERIKAYSNEEAELEKYYDLLGEMTDFYKVYECLYELLACVTRICFLMVTVTIYFCMNDDKSTTPEMFEQIFFISVRLKSVISEILVDLNRVYTSYFNIITPELHKNTKNVTIQKFYMARFYDNIEILNLSLKLGKKRILKDIFCKIYKGEKIAICGPNSSGKSVFLKSIMGNYNYKGAIFFDGFEQKQILEKTLYKNISYIPQEPSLFNKSLMDNLKLGNEKMDNSRVMELCEMFNMNSLFHELGYSESVGTLGNRLSGGQKQKVLFMRSLIKNSPILIFDQATSNMDIITEEFILKKLHKKLQKVTLLAVIKNLDMLKYFDRILFFDNGRIIGDGSFEMLFESNKRFYEFYSSSSKKQITNTSIN